MSANPWITVIGIGDDGLAGLSAEARALIDGAELLVGGERHQAMVADTAAERMTWDRGVVSVAERLKPWRGRKVVVLSTGDPMQFGAGQSLLRFFASDEIKVHTYPGAFALVCARMVWPMPDCQFVTLHGRPVENLHPYVTPGARLVALSWDGGTPAKVAELLTARGFGPSRITVHEHLGGAEERRFDGVAETWAHPRGADLNTLAVECRAGPDATLLPRAPGLPDDAFPNGGGQLTKAEVRAATMAALMPMPGQMLWDVGAGSGSVAVEWMRAYPTNRAVAVECRADRVAAIKANAAALGVPGLVVVEGIAPEALSGLPAPDAVFVGGGLADMAVFDAGWTALSTGGRMVSNAVTAEGEAALHRCHARFGGRMVRIAIERLEPLGQGHGWRPLRPVVQWSAVKS